jgi:F0F1-type ATP synthase membrane subunit b/b'
MKSWIKWLLGALFVLLLVVIALPFFFKDKIISLVKEEINKNVVNAKVDFGDIDFTLIKSFPDFRLGINNILVDGKGTFENIKLADIKSLDLDLDILSIIKGEKLVKINGIKLVNPKLNILVLENGEANYNITLPDSVQKEPSSFALKLKGYKIIDGDISYEDRQLGAKVVMNKLNHSGKGNFTDEVFDLATQTDIESLTTKYGGINYLNKVKTNMDLVLNVDMVKQYFTILKHEMKLNDLNLVSKGGLGMLPNGYSMDIQVNTPNNNFKQLMSLIPGIYTKDYSDIKADGNFTFDLALKGKYLDKPVYYPAINANLDIKNGSLQYPSLPAALSSVNGKGKVSFPGGSNLDALIIDIPGMNFNLGKDPISINLLVKNPISDPYIKGGFKGKVDLGMVQNSVKIEDMKRLSGLINGNLDIETRMSYVKASQYDKVKFDGMATGQNIDIKYAQYPDIKINSVNTSFSPQMIQIPQINAKLGKSDVQGNGNIKNPLAYFLPNVTLDGDFKLSSNFFDANEWLKAMETPTTASHQSDLTAKNGQVQASTRPFDKFSFGLDAQVGQINYDTYQLKNNIAKGKMTPALFKVEQLTTHIGQNDFNFSGQLENIFDYVFDNKMLEGKVKMTSKRLNLNEFMDPAPAAKGSSTNPPVTKEESFAPIKVPENINVMVDANIDQLTYSNMDLKNCKGVVAVTDQKMKMQDVAAQLFGGAVHFDGLYDTKGTEKPSFNMNLGMDKMPFGNVFNTFNTIKMIAPLGAYLEGIFNTKIELSGKMGEGLMPDLNTLNFSGFVHTLNGNIKNLKALEEIGNKLNISEVKSLSINDTKNWIELKNGVFNLKEFDYKLKDINFKIGGSHSLTQDMAYTIKTKIPRKLLDKNAVGAAANQGLNFLSKEASKYGVNINNGEFINVLISICGNIKNPKINIKPTGSDGSSTIQSEVATTLKETTQKVKDSIQNRANEEIGKAKAKAEEELNKAKERAQQEMQRAKDSLAAIAKKETQRIADSIKNKVKDQVGTKATEILKGKTDKVLDDKSKDVLNKASDKIKDFNPFKKKGN